MAVSPEMVIVFLDGLPDVPQPMSWNNKV